MDECKRNCSIITPVNGDDNQKSNYTGGKSHINSIFQNQLYKEHSKIDNKIKSVEFYRKKFYERDRVIRTKNDYSSSMKVNGDTGVIVDIQTDTENERIEIVYEDETTDGKRIIEK